MKVKEYVTTDRIVGLFFEKNQFKETRRVCIFYEKMGRMLSRQRMIIMVNVWDYANQLPYVTVKTVDGRIFSGETICVMDAEETDDEEDSLTIEAKTGRITTFLQSEIEQIIVHEKRPHGK